MSIHGSKPQAALRLTKPRNVTEKPDSGKLERFGLGRAGGSAHLARTMMLHELSRLLESVPDASSPNTAYIEAIELDNCLGKRSAQTRALTKRHLADLYSLNPEHVVFRALRFFWQRDPEGRPLLACLCACARDSMLRASAPFVLNLPEGQAFSGEALGKLVEGLYPGRFSKATLGSAVRNLASSWAQAGHLSGQVRKVRSRATATAGAVAFAMLLGYLSGERGETLFTSKYAKLLDCSPERGMELAETASRRGWIVFKRVGSVMEVVFPVLLTAAEMEWIREPS